MLRAWTPGCSESARGSPSALVGRPKPKEYGTRNIPEAKRHRSLGSSDRCQPVLPLSEHLRGADAKPGAETLKDRDVGIARCPRWAVGTAVHLSAYIMSCGPIIAVWP